MEKLKKYWVESFQFYTQKTIGLFIGCYIMAFCGLMGWVTGILAIIVFTIWYWGGNCLNNRDL